MTRETTDGARPKPAATGYASSAEGLRVYYEVYGRGEPIVVMAGGLMDISTMAQTIGPLSRSRQVIGIDLEGHGRTALRNTPIRDLQMPRPEDYDAGLPDPEAPELTAVGAPIGAVIGAPSAAPPDEQDRSLDFGPEG